MHTESTGDFYTQGSSVGVKWLSLLRALWGGCFLVPRSGIWDPRSREVRQSFAVVNWIFQAGKKAISMCLCVCGGQNSTSSASLQTPFIWFLNSEVRSLAGPDLIYSGSLSGCQDPGILQSSPPHHWDYKWVPLDLFFFKLVLGIELMSSCMLGKLFINGTIFPALETHLPNDVFIIWMLLG